MKIRFLFMAILLAILLLASPPIKYAGPPIDTTTAGPADDAECWRRAVAGCSTQVYFDCMGK